MFVFALGLVGLTVSIHYKCVSYGWGLLAICVLIEFIIFMINEKKESKCATNNS